ncbi:NAD(+) diphosphatase [Acidothermaceae bacterium B102]|nr:NAD(+) diphosphatase [Acidothermaceae bacterium B102]
MARRGPGYGEWVTSRTPALSRAGVDRATARRTDAAWLARAATAPTTRVLVVDDHKTLVTLDDAAPAIVWWSGAEAPDGERYFLGEQDDVAYFAVAATLPVREDARPAGLREIGALLDAADAGLLVNAIAMDNWHRTHPRCPRCGAETVSEQGGHMRRCPVDDSSHFPRTDPAVIMLVHDGADRCLLGRQPTWPEHRFSCLAGFVESGEAAEMAVVREVAEEVGVTVTDVVYRNSQPWPFPCSLMLGFRARATDETITLPDGEIEEALWLTRQGLRDAMASGAVLLPPPVSIAYQLITEWLEET